MKKLLIPAITALTLSQNVFAGTGFTGGQIESVGVIGLQAAGHRAGDMEIKIKNGFRLPAGVYCSDTNYITTLKSVDPDRAMLSLARDARTSNRSARLIITDNPAYTAYSGRCSIVAIEVF